MGELKYSLLPNQPDFPVHMAPVGKFTYLRTYSRFNQYLERREAWKETINRSSRYNVSLEEAHLKKIGVPVDYNKLNEEALLLAKNQFMLKQALSGRTLWVGGADNGVAEKFPLANFNCSFTNIEKWGDLAELFYLLLVGTGVGFKVTPKMAKGLAPVRDNFHLEMDEYVALPKWMRNDNTELITDEVVFNHELKRYEYVYETVEDGEGGEYDVTQPSRTAIIAVGDSKEGWVEALRQFFVVLTEERYKHIHTVRFNFNSVRPKGEPLKTFGGTASGHEPLKEMFELFEKVIKGTLDDSLDPPARFDETRVHMRPIHIADMANAVGYNVVVGGVRRTAEIYLFSGDPGEMDFESMFMKFGINGIWGRKAFKHLKKIKEAAKLLQIPLPKFFDSLQVQTWGISRDGKSLDWSLPNGFATEAEAQAAIVAEGIKAEPYPYNFGRSMNHRRMSNNSMAFHTAERPNKSLLDFIFLMMKGEGEPGFINLYEAARRRLKHMGITDPAIIAVYALKLGLNPCAEILLYSKGVCNLTTVNVMAFVQDGKLDIDGLMEAQRLSARSGLRMTLVELELPEWNEVQQRDRLLGTSLTGWKDAMGELGYSLTLEKELLKKLGKAARDEADRYAKELRVAAPLLVTTIKPEGTLSIVFGAVSSGLHVSHAPYYIRRIRINAQDPLAELVKETPGWSIAAEVGTVVNGVPVSIDEELRKPEAIEAARTLVIEFPVKSGAKKTKAGTYVDEQFDTYFAFQQNYTEHNTSNTIHLREHEWERACERIYEGWEDFVGVSFLSLDNNTYTLAPYETIDQQTFERMSEEMVQLNFEDLRKYEKPQEEDASLEGMEACDGGVCPIR